MKKIQNLKGVSIALVAGATMLSGCNRSDNNNASQTQNASAQTPNQNAKTYLVAMDADYPPYSFRGTKGEAIGFDVDILKAVAKNQGINITINPLSWDAVMPEVANATHDIGIGGIAPTDVDDEGFKDKVNKSYAYVYGIDTIASFPPVIDKFNDLKSHKIATLADSSYIGDAKELYGADYANKVSETKTTFLGYQQLLNGEVDAVLGDKGVLAYYAKKYPTRPNGTQKVNINTQGYYFDRYYPMTFISRKDDPELAQKLNQGIEAIIKDGTFQKIHQNWFDFAPRMIPKPQPIPEGDASYVPVSAINASQVATTATASGFNP